MTMTTWRSQKRPTTVGTLQPSGMRPAHSQPEQACVVRMVCVAEVA